MKQNKLSIKLILTITPLVILPLIGLGLLAILTTNDAGTSQTQLTINNYVIQQKEKIENYLAAFGNTIDLLSHSPVLDALTNHKGSAEEFAAKRRDLIDVFASYLDAYPDIYSIELLNRDAEDVVFHSNDLFAESKSNLIASELTKIQSKQKFLIRQKDNTSASLHYLQKVELNRFKDDNEHHWGFILFNLQPTLLNNSMEQKLSNNSINFIIAKDGQILFCNDFSLIGTFIPVDKLDTLLKIVDKKTFIELTLESVSNQRYLYAGTSVEKDFYFFSGINDDEFSEATNRIRNYTILVLVVCIILIPMLIFALVTRMLLNPIRQLAHASNEVGAGNLTVKLVNDRNDELGLLFNDFNQMINKILSYQLQLKGYHQHLEDKVSDRTRELKETNMRLESAIDEAKQANRLKSRFLANMSHEIRTPLTAIIGFTQHCLDDMSSEQNRIKYLNTVLRNSSHLIGLINNILDLSKIESEKLELEKQKYGIAELIFDIESIIHAQALEKGLQFGIDFQYPIPKFICTDITRVKQILLNVCSNAIKFTKQGFTRLNISYSEHNNQLIFVVQDSGIGMTPSEITRIFKPFEQADSSTTRRFGGTGLGLCISQSLAQLLGGDIVVTSQPDKGSCFTITIDIGLTVQDVELVYKKIPLIETTEPINSHYKDIHFDAHILIAEDNLDNQQLIRILLEKRGIKITVVNNGEEAIEAALIEDFDLILMDMQMPVMGGLEATDVLRAAGIDIPIIALTANVMKEDIQTYIQRGCDATVAKPIDQGLLFKQLDKYLNPLQNDSDQQLNLTDITNDLHNSPEFIQLVNSFINSLSTNVLKIKQAIDDENLQQISAIAHSIKGSAGNFGYPKLTELASFLEQSTKRNNIIEIRQCGFVFTEECERVLNKENADANQTDKQLN